MLILYADSFLIPVATMLATYATYVVCVIFLQICVVLTPELSTEYMQGIPYPLAN